MKIFDFVHAYQPFFHENIPDWVYKNLTDVFLPLSKAMAKGMCKRTVQIQGWTLDSWFENEQTKPLFEEFAANIRTAVSKGNIKLGFSAYSHPILPLLSNELIEMEIKEDYKTVLKYLGEPEVFFPPEGAIDQRTLDVISKTFPDATILIPDRALGMNTQSGFYRFNENVLAIFPVIIKDALMGAPYFEKPPAFIPHTVNWDNAKKALKSSKSLQQFFSEMELETVIIARDMENGQSRDALKEYKNGKKELPALYGSREFTHFFDEIEIDKQELKLVTSIIPASWEPLSHEDDPFPFWAPKGEYSLFLTEEQRTLVSTWLKLVHLYDKLIIGQEQFFKKTSPSIISCFPWHFTTPLEWDNNIGFSEYILNSCIKTRIPLLIKNKNDKEDFDKLIKTLETKLQQLQKIKQKRIEPY